MTIRNPKLNKAQVKAYADKFKDDWYARLVKLDHYNHESNIKQKNECLNAFADMVLRQDLPHIVYVGARKMIKEAEGRIGDSELREFIPNFQANHRRRINEAVIVVDQSSQATTTGSCEIDIATIFICQQLFQIQRRH